MFTIADTVPETSIGVEAHMTVLTTDHLTLSLASLMKALYPRDSAEGVERMIGSAPRAPRPLAEEILEATEWLPSAPVWNRRTYIVALRTELSAPKP